MIFHPAIMALFVGSILVGFMILYSAATAVQILRGWNLKSGSEHQLILERKTYLISTLLSYAFGFELLSFFLYIFAVDRLHLYFVGAMCAAGSLYVNWYGYPTLIVKLIVFMLAGIWLVVNHVDNSAYDYPLIRRKYAFFLLLVPLVLLDGVLQANYFLRLEPNIITSCCGTLFSAKTFILPLRTVFFTGIGTVVFFYISVLLSVGCGVFYILKGRGGYLVSLTCALVFFVSVISILSFISAYIYELPTHHCPFCLLQKEYHYIGYPLYLTLFGGTICGLSVGVLKPFGHIKSLSSTLPLIQRKLALTSLLLFLIFTAIVTAGILSSNLVLIT